MARLLLFEIVPSKFAGVFLLSNGFSSLGGCVGGGGGVVVARQKQFAKPSPLSAEGICRLPSHGDVRLSLFLSGLE